MDGIFGGANANPTLDASNPFGYLTDRGQIQCLLNAATNAGFDTQEQAARKNLANVDNANYANRANTLAAARSALLAGQQSNANQGANAAAIMQALLAGSQGASANSTSALQALQQLAAQRNAAKQQNAATAHTQANAAKGQQASAAIQQYVAEQATKAAGLTGLGQGIQGMTQTTQKAYDKNIAKQIERFEA